MRYLYFAMLFILSACTKYLDKVPDKKLTTPQSLKDFQQLLDHNDLFTKMTSLGDLGTDNYYVNTDTWESQIPVIKNSYVWAKDIFEGGSSVDWENGYNSIYICNVVLEGVADVARNAANAREFDALKGAALFYRAYHLFNLQETFGKPFRPASAVADWGVPIRTTASLTAKITRASVAETFDQIVLDLQEAIRLLPPAINFAYRNRPGKPAAFALLARVYLVMQDYDNAKHYADSSLQLYNQLVDYNALSAGVNVPFARDFAEVILQANQINYNQTSSTTSIDTTLLGLYAGHDIRKDIFFRKNSSANTYYFKGNYTGTARVFNGLATDELYLIRAECNIRLGAVKEGLADLNTLLRNRWKANEFIPIEDLPADSALKITLQERRKELLWRGLRWSDLRRLNQEDKFAITLTRKIGGQTIVLPPNDPRYSYPIPDNEIRQSQIPQNDR